MKKIITLSVLLALNGCAFLPTYDRPDVMLPDQFNPQAKSTQEQVNPEWWRNFGDPVLDNLITNALNYNQDLAAAQGRVIEAAANAGIARSALFPSIDGSGNFTRQRTSQETTLPPTPLISDVRTGYAQLSWELDIWGKLAAQNKAARARFLSSQFNRDALQLSIAAQVAQTYFQMRAADAQLNIAEDTLKTRLETLNLYQKRFKGGLISALELRQAEIEAASAEANVPQIKLGKEQTEHALSILVGSTPQQMVEDKIARGASLDKQLLTDTIPENLPSELLVRRADIRSAEEALIAAHADVGAARVAYLPTIGLTSAIGSQSLDLSSLFNAPARTWNFVGNLTLPIFNAGRIGYSITAAKARETQSIAAYQKAIQNAFSETLDALSAHQYERERETALRKQLRAVTDSLRLALLRYNNGYTDYLTVLDAQRNLYSTQLSVVSARQDRLNARVSLYKALGGGWNEHTSQKTPSTDKVINTATPTTK